MCCEPAKRITFGLFRSVTRLARESSGEHWFSRPSEHVSPRRDYRELGWIFCARYRLSDAFPFWASHILAQARRARLSERAQEATVPVFEPSLRRRGLAWARVSRLSETLQPERGVGRDNVMFDSFPWPWMVMLVGFKYCVESMRQMSMHEWYDS